MQPYLNQVFSVAYMDTLCTSSWFRIIFSALTKAGALQPKLV
ncbi:hypothetical protein PLUTE_a0859 [Pseudoalteromonas luteoviolacea DSM 6061]|nr:hypothetical protein [Pseudoalteromonas luteoviolacea DSM 6061]